ncbi:MAG: hypothetical protein ABSG53_31925, partial [Thermoguttaceae bacterium]
MTGNRLSAIVFIAVIGWVSLVLAFEPDEISGERKTHKVAPAAPPAMVDVLEADRRCPVHYQIPKADVARLVSQYAIVVTEGVVEAAHYRFASSDAAARWFAEARPFVPWASAKNSPLQKLNIGGPMSHTMAGVTFDAAQRPELWTEISKSDVELKRQVEDVAVGKRSFLTWCRVLLIDREQRVWVLPRGGDGLLGFDLRQHRCIERKNLPAEEPPKVPRDADLVPKIIGNAYQSRSGLLFFGDRLGVHVFDGKDWQFQKLYQRNIDEDRYFDPFDRPRGAPRPANSYQEIHRFSGPSFSEDSEGRV